MRTLARYGTIFGLMVKNCLVREMQFRVNFAIRVFTEVLWLGMLLVYFDAIYGNARDLGGWTHWQMLVLVGTNYVVNQLFEAFLFDNCVRLSEQIRLGELDFALVKPVEPQFLVSLRQTDFASLSQAGLGVALVAWALGHLEGGAGLGTLLLYALLVANGILILYGLLFSLATLTFWIGRASNLFELYYQFTHFTRYPAEIYRGVVRLLLLFAIPMLVVSNFPAKTLFGDLSPRWVAYGLAVGAVVFLFSTWLWRRALRSYRSASS